MQVVDPTQFAAAAAAQDTMRAELERQQALRDEAANASAEQAGSDDEPK